MINWLKKLKSHSQDKKLMLSIGISFLLLIASLIINFYAGTYATEKASSPVTDIILSNIRVFDVDWIFTYGSVLFWLFMFVVFFYRPNRLPFSLKTIALFVIIRSFFIILTHIGPFPTSLIVSAGSLMSKFTFGGDLFFSGHTGLPFLMALVFWENKIMRYTFIMTSIVFGIVVLMGHLHYSIDVLAAFFITYTIFHIATVIFKRDREIFFR